jgi:hypothetical protein
MGQEKVPRLAILEWNKKNVATCCTRKRCTSLELKKKHSIKQQEGVTCDRTISGEQDWTLVDSVTETAAFVWIKGGVSLVKAMQVKKFNPANPVKMVHDKAAVSGERDWTIVDSVTETATFVWIKGGVMLVKALQVKRATHSNPVKIESATAMRQSKNCQLLKVSRNQPALCGSRVVFLF